MLKVDRVKLNLVCVRFVFAIVRVRTSSLAFGMFSLSTGIFLSGFKLSTTEIDEKLSVFREEDGALPMDNVIALKRSVHK